MKSVMRRDLLLTIVFVVIGWLITAPGSFACTPPPVEGIAESWPPTARVLVTFDSRLNEVVGGAAAPMTTALNNWNAATALLCYEPIFTFSGGSGQTMSFAYAPIPNDPNGYARRGLTALHVSGRMDSAVSTINSNIPVTFPAVLTETIAHEMGHTMGLFDCDYSTACPLNSNVMVTKAPVATWTATEGTPGPTPCDLAQLTLNAPDYVCPPPPPPPPCTICPPQKPPITCHSPCGSPIILDIAGTGFDLTSAENGVKFDITGNGSLEQMGWTARDANNAFLALPGQDGLVHNGKELFGNFTPQPASQHPNGFLALAVYDSPAKGGNGDGIIDSRDAIFSSLRLWIDANHDGICQREELHTLPSLGVNSLSLKYRQSDKTDQYGNLFRYRAVVNPDRPDNVDRTAYDIFFVEEAPPEAKNASPSSAPSQVKKCFVPPVLSIGRSAKSGGS